MLKLRITALSLTYSLPSLWHSDSRCRSKDKGRTRGLYSSFSVSRMACRENDGVIFPAARCCAAGLVSTASFLYTVGSISTGSLSLLDCPCKLQSTAQAHHTYWLCSCYYLYHNWCVSPCLYLYFSAKSALIKHPPCSGELGLFNQADDDCNAHPFSYRHVHPDDNRNRDCNAHPSDLWLTIYR